MKDYFTFSELVTTEQEFNNVPDLLSSHTYNLQRLSIVLSVVRHIVGCPIKVNSAFRTHEVNKAVGGSLNSYHLYGRAADITCSRWSSLKSICKEFHQVGIFVECIIHDNYIHVAI